MRRRRLRLHSSSDEEDDHQHHHHQHQQQPPPPQQPPPTETPIPSNPNTNHTPTPTPTPSIPLDISDDDFIDVPENFSPPQPPPPPPPAPAPIPASNHPASSDSPVGQHLRNLGLNVRREWLDSCIALLSTSVPGFSRLDTAGKAELCFTEFLFSDMNSTGAGALPEDVHSMHLVDLPGPYVLQVDEIINIGCALKERYKHAPAGIKRCLKLSMTDGAQRVFGMEYRPIKNLDVLAPAGVKVAIQNVHIRRGLMVLVPETLVVLGGLVDDLNAARQRLVQEINKPPRGRRTRTGSAPSLATRATLAAWPSNDVSHQRQGNNSSSHLTSSSARSDQGASFGFTGGGTRRTATQDFSVPIARSNAEYNTSVNPVVNFENANVDDASMPIHGEVRERVPEASAYRTVRPSASFGFNGGDSRQTAMEDFFIPNTRSNAASNTSSNRVNFEDANMDDASMPVRGEDGERVAEAFANPTIRPSATSSTASADTRGRIATNLFVFSARSNEEPNLSMSGVVIEEASMSDASMSLGGKMVAEASSDSTVRPRAAVDTVGFGTRDRITEDLSVPNTSSNAELNASSNVEPNALSNSVVDIEEDDMIDASVINEDDQEVAIPNGRFNAESERSSNATSDVRDTDMDDEGEPLLILESDEESPFSYLSILIAKWTALENDVKPVVQGKIKCFVTGVKEFNFKGRTTYELYVYVDDGSLISVILIDHNVVQKAIGHSPKEVTAALSSQNTSVVTSMKAKMKQFQFFLANFEGIMHVEIQDSSRPVALEMNQGCSSSDTWLLLRRLKTLCAPQTPRNQHTEPTGPIEISP